MPVWSPLEWLEALSYLVTIVGLPFAIGVFLFEQREERQNEEESIYQNLSDEYADFLRLVLEHADLQLRSKPRTEALSAEQGGAPWWNWPEPLRRRDPQALVAARRCRAATSACGSRRLSGSGQFHHGAPPCSALSASNRV